MQVPLFQANRSRPQMGSLSRGRQLWAYLFILPTVVFFLVFIAIPFFRALGISISREVWSDDDQGDV